MKNRTARFWKYTGNHPNGKDCERKDPHGFGLDLVASVAYWGNSGEYQEPLTLEDTKLIKIQNHKGDDFGHEVTVFAPSEVWEKAKVALNSLK
jgi:hypothetical protein